MALLFYCYAYFFVRRRKCIHREKIDAIVKAANPLVNQVLDEEEQIPACRDNMKQQIREGSFVKPGGWMEEAINLAGYAGFRPPFCSKKISESISAVLAKRYFDLVCNILILIYSCAENIAVRCIPLPSRQVESTKRGPS